VLSEIRYALPSLRNQKEVMCGQTLALLDGRANVNGYLEVGTTGRYFDRLWDNLKVSRDVIFVNSSAPTYGAADIMERGQFWKVGQFVPLQDYADIAIEKVRDESLDLVTVYIGYHHAPMERRGPFMKSCHRILRKGGVLIVRDHDVTSPSMIHFVALAHDVFNAGLEFPWQSNSEEVRNFFSHEELSQLLQGVGFQPDDRRIVQPGDPTRNTLMKFVKV
jgi:SAM-dependent methyltransferase